ncbi:TerC/Alx family metal homeostasis membrane protein [Pendulispora albinea]|uniref:TerC/Alx family metal homeostasis membrane protein n=1 Tax=Pendulispora albinea TaxID=2741071 RepID=A0ABZ2LY60_9BACT
MTHLTTDTAALWLAFGLVVLSMLALDLGLFQRQPHAPSTRESLAWSAVWLALAATFGAGVTLQLGAAKGVQFFTAYLLEKALSVDNLFVMVLVFGYFDIPAWAQRKVLVAGVAGAFVLRTVLILPGTSLVAHFHFLIYILGALLIVAAYKLLREEPSDETRSEGLVERTARRMFRIAPALDGTRFFTRKDGVLFATPLLVTLLVIEATDVVFALDSIPAVLGATTDPFIALTSNLFAVLGLRSLYFLLPKLLARLRHLKIGLSLVLLFIGAKMLASFAFEVPAGVSLLVITCLLGGSTLTSLRSERARS